MEGGGDAGWYILIIKCICLNCEHFVNEQWNKCDFIDYYNGKDVLWVYSRAGDMETKKSAEKYLSHTK